MISPAPDTLRPPEPPRPDIERPESTLRRSITVEIEVMLRFAWSRGLPLPAPTHESLSCLELPADGNEVVNSQALQASLATLCELHALLAQTVAPAMPVTLVLMERQSGRAGWRAVLGPIGNVHRLLVASFMFLLLFVAISMSPVLDTRAMNGDLLTLDGVPQLVVMAFLLSAAGIGGSFQALFTAQRYVANATYDPRYDGSYWILIALGLVAGLLLSVLLPIDMQGSQSPTLAKPVLALLGGFSCGLVYRILQRLVEAVESVFQARAGT